MQRVLRAASFAALSVILSPEPYPLASDVKVARGGMTKVSGNSLAVQVRDHEMFFALDTKTNVEAPGGSTKQRAATAAGKPGPAPPDVIRIGQSVAVTYYDSNGALRESRVRVVSRTSATPQFQSAEGEPRC